MHTEETVVRTSEARAPVQEVRREVVETETPDQVITEGTYRKKKAIFRTYQIIWYILGVIEVLLIFRILLKAIGANPLSGFANFVYTTSDPLAVPFAGVLGVSAANGAVIEWTTFIAMAVYALVVYGIEQLLQITKPTNPQEVVDTVDTV
ncbi:YggT family protein [Candidatus Microgenomates bacterium]|nr:YggT family protein [Candidatus Microgenomates bacterium]